MVDRVEGAENVITWVLATAATAIATLAGTVATLWKVNEARNSKMIEGLNAKVEECEKDRDKIRQRADELSDQVARQEVRLAYLEQNAKQ